ncbi:hypothetical protein ES703_66644 [subsurface metagenome]
MFNWKMIGGFALFAALISLISGILGGNPFGIILLRVFISAVFLGAIGAGAGMAVKRYLPELSEGIEAQKYNKEGVDIVIDEDIAIPEENPYDLSKPLQEAEGLEGYHDAEASPEEAVQELEEVDLGRVQEIDGEPEEPAITMSPEAVEELEEEPVKEELRQNSTEALPDIDDLESDAFSSTSEPGSFAQTQVDSIMDQQNPAVLAKAVRTFLKKDEEG